MEKGYNDLFAEEKSEEEKKTKQKMCDVGRVEYRLHIFFFNIISRAF